MFKKCLDVMSPNAMKCDCGTNFYASCTKPTSHKRIVQWFPTRQEFLPGEEFHKFRGGISTLYWSYQFIANVVLFSNWHWLTDYL